MCSRTDCLWKPPPSWCRKYIILYLKLYGLAWKSPKICQAGIHLVFDYNRIPEIPVLNFFYVHIHANFWKMHFFSDICILIQVHVWQDLCAGTCWALLVHSWAGKPLNIVVSSRLKASLIFFQPSAFSFLVLTACSHNIVSLVLLFQAGLAWIWKKAPLLSGLLSFKTLLFVMTQG